MNPTRPHAPPPALDQAVFDAALQRAASLRNRALDDAVQALWRWLRPTPAALPAMPTIRSQPCRS